MIRVAEDSSTLPATVAQQAFLVGSAIGGILAGMFISKEFSTVQTVPKRLVAATTVVSILFTLGSGIYLARKAREV